MSEYMNEVRNNPSQLWDLGCLSFNTDLTMKDINTLNLTNKKGKWKWHVISANININDIRNNPNQPWFREWLSMNRQLSVKDVETLILPNSVDNWDWHGISKYIDIREVINNPNKPWNKQGLKANSSIADEILEFFDAGLLKHLQKNIPKFNYHTDIVIKYE